MHIDASQTDESVNSRLAIYLEKVLYNTLQTQVIQESINNASLQQGGQTLVGFF